ncbi:MAG: hypothetical protein ACE5FY_07620 [Nitrospiria bacterium]
MKRTQILLEESQYIQLKDEVSATGKSLSEIVREAIDSHLRERENDPLFDIVGSVLAKEDPAPADLGAQHDKYLYGEQM